MWDLNRTTQVRIFGFERISMSMHFDECRRISTNAEIVERKSPRMTGAAQDWRH